MRIVTLVVILLASTANASTDEAWELVIFMESTSGTHPNTYKDWHEANPLGIAQITPVVVRDVNRILGKEVFTLEMRVNDYLSRLMFEVICNHYAKGGSVEKLCRLWHRGPSHKRQYDSAGDLYWNRARKEM